MSGSACPRRPLIVTASISYEASVCRKAWKLRLPPVRIRPGRAAPFGDSPLRALLPPTGRRAGRVRLERSRNHHAFSPTVHLPLRAVQSTPIFARLCAALLRRRPFSVTCEAAHTLPVPERAKAVGKLRLGLFQALDPERDGGTMTWLEILLVAALLLIAFGLRPRRR
jgi:hypothetical protein